MDRLTLDRSQFADLRSALASEWLVTNGLGGFASGTVALANTRRYHGLLIATRRPPVDRQLLVAKLDAAALYRGKRYELACNEFSDGTIAPAGHAFLRSFRIEDRTPVWTFQLADALLEQRIGMQRGANLTVVTWTLIQAGDSVRLDLTPLCGMRDYHHHQQGVQDLRCVAAPRSCDLQLGTSPPFCHLHVSAGEFSADADWYWNFRHRVEQARGLDADEHLFRPGVFQSKLNPGESVIWTAEAANYPAIAKPPPSVAHKPAARPWPASTPAWIRSLQRTVDDFIVARADAVGAGTTVIAGYPWFTDWGRDTMIALPGLTLSAERAADAAQILRTFARHVDRGMLPNRFPDDDGPAEYNTADATLWFFHALDCYLERSNDRDLLRELLPVMLAIHDWHQRGTRYGIQVDPADQLLRAGEPGVQLTWMDAKIGDWVVTPRTGKPVEINALWHFAVTRLARWCELTGKRSMARKFAADAARTADNFRQRFVRADGLGLFDVVDVDGTSKHDARIRPNQLFAVSLGRELLDAEQARTVVSTCATHLLTPVGLRSLSPSDERYVGRYEGGPRERDAAYHQGTVWSWLLGPFAIAHYRAYGDAVAAQRLLDGLEAHLTESCVGQISEIFDGDAPHTPRGCFAQAWSVAETLRAWHWLEARTRKSNEGTRHVQSD